MHDRRTPTRPPRRPDRRGPPGHVPPPPPAPPAQATIARADPMALTRGASADNPPPRHPPRPHRPHRSRCPRRRFLCPRRRFPCPSSGTPTRVRPSVLLGGFGGGDGDGVVAETGDEIELSAEGFDVAGDGIDGGQLATERVMDTPLHFNL